MEKFRGLCVVALLAIGLAGVVSTYSRMQAGGDPGEQRQQAVPGARGGGPAKEAPQAEVPEPFRAPVQKEDPRKLPEHKELPKQLGVM